MKSLISARTSFVITLFTAMLGVSQIVSGCEQPKFVLVSDRGAPHFVLSYDESPKKEEKKDEKAATCSAACAAACPVAGSATTSCAASSDSSIGLTVTAGVASSLPQKTIDPDEQKKLNELLLDACDSEYANFVDVEGLITRGADAKYHGRNNFTALHLAAWHGHVAIVQLLTARSDVNAQDSTGRTPLHEAAFNGYGAVVLALLAAHADVNARDSSGRTPLHDAAQEGHVGIVQMLTSAGAADKGNSYGRTASDMAKESGYEQAAADAIKRGKVRRAAILLRTTKSTGFSAARKARASSMSLPSSSSASSGVFSTVTLPSSAPSSAAMTVETYQTTQLATAIATSEIGSKNSSIAMQIASTATEMVPLGAQEVIALADQADQVAGQIYVTRLGKRKGSPVTQAEIEADKLLPDISDLKF